MHKNRFRNPVGQSLSTYAFNMKLWQYMRLALPQDMMGYMAGRRKGGVGWVGVLSAAIYLGSLNIECDAVRLVDVG